MKPETSNNIHIIKTITFMNTQYNTCLVHWYMHCSQKFCSTYIVQTAHNKLPVDVHSTTDLLQIRHLLPLFIHHFNKIDQPASGFQQSRILSKQCLQARGIECLDGLRRPTDGWWRLRPTKVFALWAIFICSQWWSSLGHSSRPRIFGIRHYLR